MTGETYLCAPMSVHESGASALDINVDGEAVEMGRMGTGVVYVVVMAAVIVAVDVLFFRQHLWERLMANVGIVLVFGAFYLRFLWRR